VIVQRALSFSYDIPGRFTGPPRFSFVHKRQYVSDLGYAVDIPLIISPFSINLLGYLSYSPNSSVKAATGHLPSPSDYLFLSYIFS
jgi:hypothetical protein